MRDTAVKPAGGKRVLKSAVRSIRKDYIAYIMIAPALICYLVYLWHPMFSGIMLSFYKTQGFERGAFAGINNYITVLKDPLFYKALGNSAKYTLWALVIESILPIILAVFVNEIMRGKKLFTTIIYLPCMIPGIVASVMWKIMFDPSDAGLFNTIIERLGGAPLAWLQDPRLTIMLIVVSISWAGIGSKTILYIANLQSVSVDLYEAASLDGAGFWSRVKNITLPHMSGLIKMLIVMQIIGVFKIFQQPLTMTGGGPDNESITLMIYAYQKAFEQFRVDESAAVSVLVMIILMIFTVVYFKVTNAKENGSV